MYKGKHSNAKIRSFRPLIFMLCLFLIFSSVAGVSMAYLKTGADEVENSFIPGKAEISISENKSGNTKSDICIVNSNDAESVPVYVRATLVICWEDYIEGEWRVVPKPADAQVNIGSVQSGWFTVGDTYYYKTALQPGQSSTAMLSPIEVVYDGQSTARCIIDVRAEAIQAEPITTVMGVWPVSVSASGVLSAA